MTSGTLTSVHREGMKGAQCNVSALPALLWCSGCTRMTSAWFLSLPRGQRTNKRRVASQILSLNARNQAIVLCSSHPQGIKERKGNSVRKDRETSPIAFCLSFSSYSNSHYQLLPQAEQKEKLRMCW